MTNFINPQNGHLIVFFTAFNVIKLLVFHINIIKWDILTVQ